jgi:hypothetical protein
MLLRYGPAKGKRPFGSAEECLSHGIIEWGPSAENKAGNENQPIRTVAYDLISGEQTSRTMRTHEVGQVLVVLYPQSEALPGLARYEAPWYE